MITTNFEPEMSSFTHIQITVELRDRLRDLKRGQESYDQLIRRILDRTILEAIPVDSGRRIG